MTLRTIDFDCYRAINHVDEAPD